MKPLFFAAVFLSLLMSCADNDAHVSNVTAVTVFDFSDESSAPSVRLSVFAEALSPVNRGSSILIRNEETGLSWKARELQKASDGSKKSWTGFSSFEVPKNFKLPSGSYSFVYEDYAENTWESSFKVNYNEDFINFRSSDFPEKISVSRVEKYILYNEKGDIIFYGDRKKEWNDLARAARDYKTARSGRICYYIPSTSVMVLMPAVSLNEKQAENSGNKDGE